jgi:hypothetical protein
VRQSSCPYIDSIGLFFRLYRVLLFSWLLWLDFD